MQTRRDFVQRAFATTAAVAFSSRVAAKPALAESIPLRWPVDPRKAVHVQGSDVLSAAPAIWHQVPADLQPVSMLALDNISNSARASLIEKYASGCRASGIRVAPEMVRDGKANETITPTWLDGLFKEHPNVVAIGFNCTGPGPLKTKMLREYLEVCGRNGAYLLYNMNRKSNTLPEQLRAMIADEELVASMRSHSRNIILNYASGGFKPGGTDPQKAECLELARRMLADGLIGRVACFGFQINEADVARERLNGCTAFGGNLPSHTYWHALRNPESPALPRIKIPDRSPMHFQTCTVTSEIQAAWRQIPVDVQRVSILTIANWHNAARAELFESCFDECQKNAIPALPEVVRYGASNESINPAWLDGMFQKYQVIVGAMFGCDAAGQLKTRMMRQYLDICAQNGGSFLFNACDKSMTLPDDLDKIVADRELVAVMQRYRQHIVVDYRGGGLRGSPTDGQAMASLQKLKQMLADGVIGRIAGYRSEGSEVAREQANGCTVFGCNDLGARNAAYWAGLRKAIAAD